MLCLTVLCCLFWMDTVLILIYSLHFAKDNGIIIFCLPPHTTPECQPLDCSLFKPLKDKWREECHKFYAKNPGMVINKFNFCRIFRGAWLSAVNPENIISGFRKGGIYPYNRNAIYFVCRIYHPAI